MKNKKLYKKFFDAVEVVNNHLDPIPSDLLLKLYACYKVANKNLDHSIGRTPLVNAFKANALIQAQSMSIEEAMKEYIKLVKKEIIKK